MFALSELYQAVHFGGTMNFSSDDVACVVQVHNQKGEPCGVRVLVSDLNEQVKTELNRVRELEEAIHNLMEVVEMAEQKYLVLGNKEIGNLYRTTISSL